ncbi:MAG TPA: serine hydrolase domain-containing protein [Longimicrobiaceae bacterium]|nr:serine hydrolase domain-containing protein [Longimicrobiaceae bacterium]
MASHAGAQQQAAAPGERVERAVRTLDGRTLQPEQVRATVERLMRTGRVPGLGLAILNRGEIVYLRGFGERDVERHLPFTERTVTYAASFTKSMFAYMVMQLVEEGSIGLDRPIGEYLPRPLPECPKYADLAGDDRWRGITPRMLLSHTSGLPNWRFTAPDEKLRFDFDPGARYAYSGEGINLLQLVVEEATHRPVGELMRERVFVPLGMTRTDLSWRPEWEDELAIGYDEAGKPLGHNRRGNVRAAGSADADIADVARFVRGVLRGQGMSVATREEMLRPQVRIRSAHQFPTANRDTTDRDDGIALSYGLGWGVLRSPHGAAYFKEGHDDGWENYMITFDRPGTALVVMTNSSNGESIFKELLATLIGDTYTPWEWERYTPYDAPAETRD